MENDTISQPVSPTPQEVQAIPLETPPQGFSFKGINKKLLIIVSVVLGLIIIFLISLFVIPKKNKQPVAPPVQKTWEIIFSYNPSKDSFTLTKLTLLNKQIKPDYRSAKFSDFKLNVLSADKKVLYATNVTIMTEILDRNLLTEAYSSGSAVSPASNIQNILYAPHFEDENTITLTRSGKVVLELVVPISKKKSSLNFPKIPDVHAADICSPLKVAFISDNYTDFNQFHKEVQLFENAFINTAPYSSKNPSIFDFKIVDNSQPLGCASNGIMFCINNQQPLISQIVRQQYPDISKIIVITNASQTNPKDGSVLGVTSGIGGDFAFFPNNLGNIGSVNLIVAKHEFLGHAVGNLYDRYVAVSPPGYGLIQKNIKSNCTNNSAGEPFWAQAGISATTLGCANPAQYAPAAPQCPKPGNPSLSSAGTQTSIMSAVRCGGPNFDAVEQYWITNNILPDYTGCAGGVTPPVGTTGAPTPSTTPASQSSNKIIVTVFTDTNNNGKQDVGESGIQGASITLSGALNQSTNTDINGGVTFQDVPAGGYTLVAKISGQIVGQGSFSIPNDVITTVHFTIPVSPQFAANPTPITIAPTVVTPSSSPTPLPTQGFEPNGTPAPTPDTLYNCYLDPACVKSGKSIQQCKLICTPQ